MRARSSVIVIRAQLPALLRAFALVMNSSIVGILLRRSRPLFFITVSYGIACALAMAFGWGGAGLQDLLAAWGSLPIGFAICALL